VFTGAAIGFPLDIDDDNDEFTLRVDGVTSGTLSLTQGTYNSGAELAAELQARINGDSALAQAGARVSVVFNTDRFEITSEEYGGGSNVEFLTVDTNTATELGLAVGAGSAGLDVAGTIGGVGAIGVGTTLTGAAGSDAFGLQIRVNGSGVGPRGDVDFSRGLAYQLDALIQGYLDDDGILEARTDSLQDRAEDLVDERDRLDLRIESLEARYRAQFTALDTLLAQLQTTSSFLTQQLASLPGANSSNQ